MLRSQLLLNLCRKYCFVFLIKRSKSNKLKLLRQKKKKSRLLKKKNIYTSKFLLEGLTNYNKLHPCWESIEKNTSPPVKSRIISISDLFHGISVPSNWKRCLDPAFGFSLFPSPKTCCMQTDSQIQYFSTTASMFILFCCLETSATKEAGCKLAFRWTALYSTRQRVCYRQWQRKQALINDWLLWQAA